MEITCLNCGRVAFACLAEGEDNCAYCGYRKFRLAKESDAPRGVTIRGVNESQIEIVDIDKKINKI